MLNCQIETKGNELIIRVDLSQRHGASSSGKTEIIASSQGNQSVPGHEAIKLGLNVYTARKV